MFEVSCVADTWVDFEKEVSGDTSGTWEKTNGLGLNLSFNMAMGSTWHATADTWSAGNFHATANQANGLATEGNIYEIEDIRVSVGKSIKTEWRPQALDVQHCLRYFEIGYIYAKSYMTTVTAHANDHHIESQQFAALKRVAPTITLFGSTGNAHSVQIAATYSVAVQCTGYFSNPLNAYWKASARLI